MDQKKLKKAPVFKVKPKTYRKKGGRSRIRGDRKGPIQPATSSLKNKNLLDKKINTEEHITHNKCIEAEAEAEEASTSYFISEPPYDLHCHKKCCIEAKKASMSYFIPEPEPEPYDGILWPEQIEVPSSPEWYNLELDEEESTSPIFLDRSYKLNPLNSPSPLPVAENFPMMFNLEELTFRSDE